VDELSVPAVFDQAGDVGAAERMQIEAIGKFEVVAVPPESP